VTLVGLELAARAAQTVTFAALLEAIRMSILITQFILTS
jgi:hypothetical protein